MDLLYTEDLCYQEEEIPFMPEDPELAMAYVPFQKAGCLYNPVKGLSVGTMFPELRRPYMREPFCGGYDND